MLGKCRGHVVEAEAGDLHARFNRATVATVQPITDAAMPKADAGRELLENAYNLSTPEDNITYYRAFAASYDTDFAEGLGWHYPAAIAAAYRRLATDADVPIADIGCGTGLVASALGMAPQVIDGMDISPEMLELAAGRKLYRALHQADLTGSLAPFGGGYGAVLSAGTFTHGHLGPGPLRNLLGIARPGGLFVIGVNSVHFDNQRFAAVLQAMTAAGEIGEVETGVAPMYSKPGHAHSSDRALILQYRNRWPRRGVAFCR